MPDLTDADLLALLERLDAAHAARDPGEWVADWQTGGVGYGRLCVPRPSHGYCEMRQTDAIVAAETVNAYPQLSAALRRLLADRDQLREEAAWVRRKLELPEDTPANSGKQETTLYGTLHVVCSHAHGYETYIKAYKCNDKQGEIARLTVERDAARAEVERLNDRWQAAVGVPLEQAEELARSMKGGDG